jgi:lysophospholipase L1-like esterase
MARHRLVTIGDSITQGVRSGAAVDGTLSWPRFLAAAMGVEDEFRSPVVAPAGRGLPVDLEYLATEVLDGFGTSLGWLEVPLAALRVRSWMDDVEDYWENGPGSTPAPPDGLYHNLGILGFDLRDALSLTATECEKRIAATPRRDGLFNQVPEAGGLRIARQILAAAGPDETVFDAAETLADDGGIEVVVVMLGSNNALQVASDLEVHWSGAGYDDLDEKGPFTLWRPEHFAAEYDLVVERAAEIGAEHTVLATVPKVTIIPLARGVNGKVAPGSRYYEHYTRIWIDDESFDPTQDKCITHQDARRADAAIDAYNDHIRAAAAARGPNWHVFELGDRLDSMATKRYLEDPSARPTGFEPYRWPSPLDRLDPPLGTKFFRSEHGRRSEGGIFSLDGIHPTVIGSALIAHELAELLRAAGVEVGDVDLGAALAADELNSDPPDIVDSLIGVIGWLDQISDAFSSLARIGR